MGTRHLTKADLPICRRTRTSGFLSPHFGFKIASKHGLSSQWEGVPDEAFMVLILDDNTMEGVSGIARYRDEFNEAM